MKIRHDTAFVSSLLFTIAFVCLARWEWWLALPGDESYHLEQPWKEVSRLMGVVGRQSLVIILIGLIVVWTGYLKKLRWTWFIMFVIVFAWAFPILIWHDILHSWAFLQKTRVSDWLGLFTVAVREPGPTGDIARGMVEEILLFSLMVVALFLPMKPFFFGARKGPIRTGHDEG
jgi:hypothetical protein